MFEKRPSLGHVVTTMFIALRSVYKIRRSNQNVLDCLPYDNHCEADGSFCLERSASAKSRIFFLTLRARTTSSGTTTNPVRACKHSSAAAAPLALSLLCARDFAHVYAWNHQIYTRPSHMHS